jgi:hypothetical protein
MPKSEANHQVVDFQREPFCALDGQPLIGSGLALLDLVVADLVASVVGGRLPRQEAASLRDVTHLGPIQWRLVTPAYICALSSTLTRGRCYDHNFLRLSTIFGEKIGVFLKKTNVMINILQNLALF